MGCIEIMRSKEHYGTMYAILSGLLYGFVGYFGVSIVHASTSVTNMLFWRFFIASIAIGFFIIRRRKDIQIFFHKEMLFSFINGAVFYGLSTTLYFFACPYIGSGVAMVLFFTYPAIVILLNYLLYRQKIPRIYYLALIIIFTGMLLLIEPGQMRFNLFGIVLSIISAFLYAAYIVSSKKINTLSPSVSTFMVCLGCMVICLFFSIGNNSLRVPSSLAVWINLLGIAIVSTSIPIMLLLYSLNYINSEKASLLSVLEPVFVFIFGVILLNEPMKLRYLFGSLIILSGALLTLMNRTTRELPLCERQTAF